MGQFINLTAADGFTLPAYVAVPAGKAKGAVVVLQEIFGVNSHIQSVADGYAAAGYLAVAPATFHRAQPGVDLGYTEADYKRAFELYKGFNEDKGTEDVGAALAALRAERTKVMGDLVPASTLLFVSGLADPRFVVEIEGEAVA